MIKKIFDFLTKTKIGLLLLINLFFVAGLLGASGLFLGGLIWFGGNVFFMTFAAFAKVPNTTPATGGGTVIEEDPVSDEEQQL